METTFGEGTKLSFIQCPTCGGTRRLAGEVLKLEQEKGKIPKESNVFLFAHQSVIESVIARSLNWLSAPIIFSYFDVCVECGTVYCIHAEIQKAVQGGKNMPKAWTQFGTS